MINRFVRLATIRNTQIRVHMSYFVFISLLVPTLFVLTDFSNLVAVVELLAYLFLSVLIHEFGHAYAAKVLGHEVSDITVYPFGGMASIVMKKFDYAHHFFIAFAGPLANILTFCIFLLFEDFKLFSTFSGINLLIGVSNLIPVKSFDGGTMLSCFLASHINEEVAHKVLTMSTILIVAMTAAASVYFKSLFVGVIAVFLFMYSLAWKDEGV